MTHIVKIIADTHPPDARLAKEITSLKKHGYTIHVICWDRDGLDALMPFEANEHGNVYRKKTGAGRGASLKFLLRLVSFYMYALRHIRKLNAEFVHIHSLQVLPLGVLIKVLFRKVLIYDVHEITETFGTGIHKKIGKLVIMAEKFLLKWVDGVLTVSEALEERYVSFTRSRIPVQTLRNCLDLNVHSVKQAVGKRPLVLGRIGNLRTRSRIDFIADVICRINELGYPTVFKYAGQNIGGYDAVSIPAHEQMKAYAEYTEWIPLNEFSSFYKEIDLIINVHEKGDPLEEKFAYFSKVFEASSFATPCIINDFPSMTPIVKENNLGVVVGELKVEEFVEELIRIHNHREIISDWSSGCIIYVKDKLNWTIMEKRLISLYEKLTA